MRCGSPEMKKVRLMESWSYSSNLAAGGSCREIWEQLFRNLRPSSYKNRTRGRHLPFLRVGFRCRTRIGSRECAAVAYLSAAGTAFTPFGVDGRPRGHHQASSGIRKCRSRHGHRLAVAASSSSTMRFMTRTASRPSSAETGTGPSARILSMNPPRRISWVLRIPPVA